MNLEKFVQAADPLRALAVKVTQNGETVAEHYWESVCRRNVYSVSKSFTAMAVGIAQREAFFPSRRS